MDSIGPNGTYEPSRGFLKKQIDENVLFKDEHLPKFEFLEYETLLDSSDMRPANWFALFSPMICSCSYNLFCFLLGSKLHSLFMITTRNMMDLLSFMEQIP